jgi:hypothetical protein
MDKNEQQRDDKHLLPCPKLTAENQWKTNNETVWKKYEKLYMIFNSENIWINLQYHCPRLMYFDLHDEE